MKRLKHKNIVELYDFIITKNNYYFVMEFCGAGDLH
jgi:serine/threonine protein kinase